MINEEINSRFLNSDYLVDQYENLFEITEEIARGGQGVVFRTTDPDIAIKQPLGSDGAYDQNTDFINACKRIRALPLPAELSISLPVSILKEDTGYVMPLLNGMKPMSTLFYLSGEKKEKLKQEKLPQWLSLIPSCDDAIQLLHYAKTGSTKKRLYALYKCAAILARLHAVGLIYGDVSPNNVFVDSRLVTIGKYPCGVWLIDAENIRFEYASGGQSIYTPTYGSPEVVKGEDSSRPYSDIWAFSVMAFEMLSLVHPFIGQSVLGLDDDEWGWDDESSQESVQDTYDKDELAYRGFFPFIDDKNDRSNSGVGGLPREIILTPLLNKLFQETLGEGRTRPWQRSVMILWALALAQAHDRMVTCPDCGMSYYIDNDTCPFCGKAHPIYAIAKTENWEMVIENKIGANELELPKRLFNVFSPRYGDDTAYYACADFGNRKVLPVRGTQSFPDDLEFEFIEEGY